MIESKYRQNNLKGSLAIEVALMNAKGNLNGYSFDGVTFNGDV
jgi:hypothetical protein